MLTRRNLMQTAGAACLTSFVPRQVLADLDLGGASLTTVSDGYLTLPRDFIFGPMPSDELPAVLSAFDVADGPLTPECNLTLYRDNERTVLFDVGSGPDFMPTAGSVLDALDALDLAPEDVTDVVFTHAHPDHIWGLLDDFDGAVPDIRRALDLAPRSIKIRRERRILEHALRHYAKRQREVSRAMFADD